MKTKDRAMQRYGRLVAMEIHSRGVEAGVAAVFWRCKCDCGREAIVSSCRLQKGTRKSCGCLRGKRTEKSHGTPRLDSQARNGNQVYRA